MTALELKRRDLTKSLAPAHWVVPAFDDLEDRNARLGFRLAAPVREQLALKRCEEALAHGVVVGIAHRSHRRPNAGFLLQHRLLLRKSLWWLICLIVTTHRTRKSGTHHD